MNGVVDAVGSTPLIYLKSLSEFTGCRILAKAEFMNPGGSIKDRTAKGLVAEAERQNLLKPGDTIVEGTAGNTGIGICLIAAAKGYKAVMYVPDNQSQEKIDVLKTLGAEVIVVPAVPFSNPNHFYHSAKRHSIVHPNCYFPDQFENLGNYNIHYTTTGPEIWEQSGKNIDHFVVSAGTGGTVGGVSSYLKEQNSNIKVYLVDPPGSGLFNYIVNGKMEADGRKTITQGIGIIRETANFAKAKIDGAIVGENRETIEMMHHLLKKDGLFIGSSAGINCVAAVRIAQKFGPGKTIVTVLPDGGQRYMSGLFNNTHLQSLDLVPSATGLEFMVRDDSKVVERK